MTNDLDMRLVNFYDIHKKENDRFHENLSELVLIREGYRAIIQKENINLSQKLTHAELGYTFCLILENVYQSIAKRDPIINLEGEMAYIEKLSKTNYVEESILANQLVNDLCINETNKTPKKYVIKSRELYIVTNAIHIFMKKFDSIYLRGKKTIEA